jgi:biotin carboxyl carrier protein
VLIGAAGDAAGGLPLHLGGAGGGLHAELLPGGGVQGLGVVGVAAGGGAAGGGAGSGKIAVPMQGTIVKVLVEPGQTVAAGDPVVVLEAMKMENNVAADIAGTVTEVKAEAGQSVAAGEIVVVIEAES